MESHGNTRLRELAATLRLEKGTRVLRRLAAALAAAGFAATFLGFIAVANIGVFTQQGVIGLPAAGVPGQHLIQAVYYILHGLLYGLYMLVAFALLRLIVCYLIAALDAQGGAQAGGGRPEAGRSN